MLIGPHLEQSMENRRLLALRSLSVIHALTAAHATVPDGKGGTTLVARQQPVPEFLYQVTRMLMEYNPQIIEWSSMGRILVGARSRSASRRGAGQLLSTPPIQ
jgi:hypothetical protein